MIRRALLALLAALLLCAAPAAAPAAAQEATPLARLTEGLAASLADASALLREGGQRRPAMMALNDARRAARVLRHAAPGEAVLLAHGALGVVETARKHVQNGAPDKAVTVLEHGAAALRRSAGTPLPASDRVGGAAVGMDLVNARGARIGEVEAIDGDQAIIRAGGVIDLFGFWDIGTHSVRVPAADILAGDGTAAYPTSQDAEAFAQAPAGLTAGSSQ